MVACESAFVAGRIGRGYGYRRLIFPDVTCRWFHSIGSVPHNYWERSNGLICVDRGCQAGRWGAFLSCRRRRQAAVRLFVLSFIVFFVVWAPAAIKEYDCFFVIGDLMTVNTMVEKHCRTTSVLVERREAPLLVNPPCFRGGGWWERFLSAAPHFWREQCF